MKILFIGSGEVIERMIIKALEMGHCVVGLIKEPGNNYDFKINDLKFYKIEDISDLKCELGIINQYKFLINIDNVDFPIINYHSGILPQNRGFSSNLMAYLNHKEIGFSVNLINNFMDEGEIVYVKKIQYNHENYKTISKKIYNLMENSLGKVIDAVRKNKYKLKQNSSSKIIYNTKLNPKDGILKNYSFSPQFYIKFFDIYNNGSGLFISHNEKKIRITDLTYSELDIDQSFFIIGSVVNFMNEFHWIRIPNGYLKIKLEKKIKIGSRLDGFQWFEKK
jgi:methionyl-tRNA formyltransferase